MIKGQGFGNFDSKNNQINQILTYQPASNISLEILKRDK